jgi:hypothetical protein
MKVDLQNVRVVKKFDVLTLKKKNGDDFLKQEFIVKASEYDHVKITAMADKLDFLKNINEGDTVDVSFFVGGWYNEAKGDCWNNLNMQFIKKAEGQAVAQPVDSHADNLPF